MGVPMQSKSKDSTKAVAKRSANIRESDAVAVAELVAKRLTEKEACLLLDIPPAAWFTWKSRNKDNAKFGDTVARVRAASVKAHIDNIESAGYGQNGHRADWRASECYLKVTDPMRFNEKLAMLAPSETDALADSLLSKMLARAYADKPSVDANQVRDAKQLESTEAIDVQAIEEK